MLCIYFVDQHSLFIIFYMDYILFIHLPINSNYIILIMHLGNVKFSV